MDRYSRHRNLFSAKQFEQIENSKVLVAGAGGLGCTVLQLLVRTGIKTIHIYDYAQVDLPDLNRQILYDKNDIDQNKAICAAKKLNAINSEVSIISHLEKIDENTELPDIDIVFDCLDNFKTRFIVDKLLSKGKTPMIHAGVNKYSAQITSIVPGKSKSLSELFPIESSAIDSQINKDIFPPLVTITASIQVTEGLKFLTKRIDEMLINKVLMIDSESYSFEIEEFK
ncbi:MAG: ThiF family adenylyltransferase [Bacteroidales bacterium]